MHKDLVHVPSVNIIHGVTRPNGCNGSDLSISGGLKHYTYCYLAHLPGGLVTVARDLQRWSYY